MTLSLVPSASVAAALDASPQPRRGRRPHLLLAVGVGVLALLVQTVGYLRGWAGDTDLPIVLWYLGFVALCLPFAALLLSRATPAGERLATALAFTVLLYLSWLLANPVFATAFDETLHVTSLVRLIHADPGLTNTVLPVSPFFPGLELAASGVHWLTGLPLMACQVLVVLVSRVALTVALFLLAERITRSTRAAGIVVLLYAASAQFYFFNAQFSYQTMALALLVGVLWLLARACDATEPARAWRWLLAAEVCLTSLVVTHHLTSWLTIAGLWVLALLFHVGGEPVRARRTAIAAGVGTVLAALWALSIAQLLARYLGPIFDNARTEVLRLVELEVSRSVGADGGGGATPTWQLVVMGLAALVWCACLLPATRAAWRSHTWPSTTARLLPVGLGLAFPALLLARFAPSAAEVAGRASTFVTLALALVVGAWLVTRIDRIGLLVAVPVATLVLLGGALLGSGPDWQRTPGPYVAGAEQRSVDAETMAVAQWSGRYLPSGSRIAADVTLARVVPTVAPVEPVTSASGSVNVTDVFVSTSLDRAREVLVEGEVDFVLVDTRIEGETVRSGSYFEGSNGWGPTAMTLDADQIGKFVGAADFEPLLAGPIQVYDVRSLRGEPSVFADRPAPGLPGTWRAWQVALVAVALALLLGLGALRRRPRPWRSSDAVPVVLALPVLTLAGTLAPLAGFEPVKGALLAVIGLGVAAALRWRTTDPSRLPHRWWTWSLPALGLVVAFVLASYGAWHGLLDHPPLPSPGGVS